MRACEAGQPKRLGIWLKIAAGCGLCLVGHAALAEHDWQKFNNPVQHFSGCYPADVFTAEEPPELEEPEALTAGDGAAATMYVTRDEAGESLREEMLDVEATEFGAGGKVVYQTVKNGFYLFVGFEGGEVVYEKAILGAGYFETFRVTYPKALQLNYDPLVRRMASCFQATK
jgi:hypothetical protein